ncbi:magnesium transporter [Mycena leptocephala]|nr:magnesium transporter [Mycena leptocephala]
MSSESEPAFERDGETPMSPIYGNGNSNGGQVSLKSRSKRSLHAHYSPGAFSERRPIDKFRSTVNKIITMKRSTTILAAVGAGAEPGIDPRRASMELQYRTVHKECVIEVVDYSAVSSSFTNMRNSEFVDWCAGPKSKRQPWVKVRWINITGVSWDVIKALSFKHELHPLALEDVLHTRPDNLSKADYFLHHLFLRILIHDVEDESSSSPSTFVAEDSGLDPSAPTSKDAIRQRKIDEAKLDALKQGTLRVSVSPMFVFLYRDGTVISITQQAPPDLMLPIIDRLRRADTILRSSADPSMLVQSVLGLVVDKAVQVIDAYHDQISKIEHQILIKPKPTTVRKLHIVSGDLVLHKRTLEPIKTLVYGLRRYDVDRCAALVDDSDPATMGQPIVGFMSHKSKIYLADIFDHTEYILSTLDMIAGIGESLTDYSFNMASYSMNDTMRLLTMITIICLPLTFLTGYFGMNFENEKWRTDWSDVLFWIIALPSVGVISPLFIIPDIKKMWHYIQTRKLLKVRASSSIVVCMCLHVTSAK